MADRFDKSFSRRPVAATDPASGRRGDLPFPQEDDPLVELARIVSGNQSFDDIVGSRPSPQPAPPIRSQPVSARPAHDVSFDLESELLNDLQTSFEPTVRSQPSRQPANDPAAMRAPARETGAGREAFDHLRLRPGQPVTPARAAVRPVEPPVEDDPYAGTAYAGQPNYSRSAAPEPAVSRNAGSDYRAGPSMAHDAGSFDHDDGYDAEDEANRAYYDEDELDQDDDWQEAGYAPEPPRRSRKGLITAAIVLAVVLAGGVGMLALKNRSSSTASSTGAPRIIAADESPTKIQPAVQPQTEADGQQNKAIYDRANSDTASQEQLVLPDDGAVDEKPATNESAASREISRIILPGGPDAASADADSTSSADPDATVDGVGPRKVRTVVVKPDGTIVSSEAAPRGAQAADTSAPAAEVQTAANALTPPTADPSSPALSAPADNAPVADAAVPAKDVSQMAAPAATPRVAAVKPTARPAPTDTTTTAAVTAVAPAVTGGFVVQVTSQRSQEQAVAAYKNLQKKFPSVLGDRAPDIARADLGAKGVYYRARIGPMASRDEAISFCEQLKSAGGDCIVQRN